MPTLLALDLGVTTGWAVLQDEHQVIARGTILSGLVRDRVEVIRKAYKITVAVIEKPVIMRGPLGDELQTVINQAELSLPDVPVSYVTPSEWKSHPLAKNYPLPPGLSVHEKDAIRLGAWFFKLHLQGEQ